MLLLGICLIDAWGFYIILLGHMHVLSVLGQQKMIQRTLFSTKNKLLRKNIRRCVVVGRLFIPREVSQNQKMMHDTWVLAYCSFGVN